MQTTPTGLSSPPIVFLHPPRAIPSHNYAYTPFSSFFQGELTVFGAFESDPHKIRSNSLQGQGLTFCLTKPKESF